MIVLQTLYVTMSHCNHELALYLQVLINIAAEDEVKKDENLKWKPSFHLAIFFLNLLKWKSILQTQRFPLFLLVCSI